MLNAMSCIVRVGDGDSLHGHLIGVTAGYRRGCSIGYVVLIISRAMKRTQP